MKMAEIVCRRSKLKSWMILACCLGCFALGLLMLIMPDFFTQAIPAFVIASIAWTDTAVFGMCSAILILIMVKLPSIQVVINDKGIYSYRSGWIHWKGIKALYRIKENGPELLALQLEIPHRYDEKTDQLIPTSLHSEGSVNFAINFEGLTPGIERVWEFISQKYADKVEEGKSI